MSSPLRDTDREDIPRSEMSRRMKKRARQTTNDARSSLYQEQDLAEPARNTKRLKRTPALGTVEADITFPASTHPADHQIPIHSSVSYQTPKNISPVSKTLENGLTSARSGISEQLSPLPKTRRMLSRTSSRSLKENSTSMKGLASPFHSRSGSKVNSPKKKTAKKPAFYTKARTLSEAKCVDDNVMIVESQVTRTQNMLESPPGLRRTSSYDHMSLLNGNPFDQLPDEVWFRPPKALSRSPFDGNILPAQTPLLDWSFETAAFYGDHPQAESTPFFRSPDVTIPQNEGTPSAPNSPEMDINGDVLMQESLSDAVHPAAHRRTVVHYSRDSIFSSTFADSMTAALSHGLPRVQDMGPLAAINRAPGSPAFRLSPAAEVVTTPCSSPAAELTGMLGTRIYARFWLFIIGTCFLGRSPASHALALPQRSRSLGNDELSGDIRPLESLAPKSRRRDRAGTIRASDFGQKTSDGPARVTMAAAPNVPAGYMRTRSGTIRPSHPPTLTRMNSEPTVSPVSAHPRDDSPDSDDPLDLLKYPIDIEARLPAPAQKTQIPPAVRRRIEMIDDVGMDVGMDESDDELLLLGGRNWNWDGRWN
ncbi:hypothetical protein EWM64_g357 [Hericium alpestre]|uniref:Uncharacterized protein n=1 Tax=Hericium alpestre TaxID=135208 RepID=A0A4Z0ABD6_9AGAM|nr:hypothetical protein EWM64_g357 [Hericium alpestre]